MIRIKALTAYAYGACSFYRSMGVLPHTGYQIDLLQKVSFEFLMGGNIFYVERPDRNDLLQAIRAAKKLNMKIWIDFDDDLFCLPSDNSCANHYNNLNVQKIMVESIKLSDVVTVATEEIKNQLLKYNKNIIVIENAFNNFNFKFKKNLSKNKIVMWRGSETHVNDLYTYKDEINGCMKKYKDWDFLFFGKLPWLLMKNFVKKEEIQPQYIIDYFDYIYNINPSVFIVPLVFNKFNLSKSNIAWIEGTYSGAVCLAPDMPEWRRPGIVNYSTCREFYQNLNMLMSDEGYREENYYKSFEYIKKNLLLSDINKKRIKIIKNLSYGQEIETNETRLI